MKPLDKLELAILQVRREDKTEKSAALRSWNYQDPARNIKYRGEHMESTKKIENLLRHELDNWIRWGRKKDWKPVGFKCPLGYMFRSTSYPLLQCDEPQAVKLERIVVGLPELHRRALVMHQLDRAAVNGFVRIVIGRDEKARLLGVGKSRYHELVNQALKMVLRHYPELVLPQVREADYD